MVSRKNKGSVVKGAQAREHGVQAFVASQLEEARRRFDQYEKDLLELGLGQQRELEAVLARVRSGRDLRKLGQRASVAATEVRRRLDLVQGQVLSVLGVASQDQIREINRELSRLSKRVELLLKKGSPATAKASGA
jgi:hypothetical protein